MSFRRKKPAAITDLAKFEADMTAISATILRYAHNLRTNSPQYRPLDDLHIKLCETIEKVTGEELSLGSATDGRRRTANRACRPSWIGCPVTADRW